MKLLGRRCKMTTKESRFIADVREDVKIFVEHIRGSVNYRYFQNRSYLESDRYSVFHYNFEDINEIELSTDENELLDKELSIVLPRIAFQLGVACGKILAHNGTRQAIIVDAPNTPEQMMEVKEDGFPCINIMHLIASNHKLDLKAFMRSSNIEKMLVIDLVFLSRILTMACSATNQKPGVITVFISNAHVEL
jgi:hypothetical protein